MHVTEVESFVSTARRAGLALTDDEVDGYYTEQRRAAALVGLDPADVPGTAAEVADYYRRIRRRPADDQGGGRDGAVPHRPADPVEAQPAAAGSGLHLGPPRWAYLGIAGTALGLLPAWARRLYGGLGLPTTALSADLSVRTLRLALAALPRRYREGPLQQAAKERAARLTAPATAG